MGVENDNLQENYNCTIINPLGSGKCCIQKLNGSTTRVNNPL